MNFKYKSILAIVIGAGVLMLSAIGCEPAPGQQQGQQQGRNIVNQQKDNILGDSLGQAGPNAGQNDGILGGHNDAGSGNNPPDVGGVETPVNPDERFGINLGAQHDPQRQAGFDRQRAENIQKQLDNANGIEQVNVVVKGHTALVAYEAADMNAARNMVVDKVKQADVNIQKVVVANTPDDVRGIRELNRDLKNDRPLQELNLRYDQLINRINPAR